MLGNSSYVKGPPIHVRRKSKYDQQRTLLFFEKKKKEKVRKSNSIFEREKEEKNWDFSHSQFDLDEILVCCF
jgi:hypothetical protein